MNRPATHKSFKLLGKTIASSYGIRTAETADELIQRLPSDRETVCLLAALVAQMESLERTIAALPSQMAKSQLAEERALEKEKQKTARAQEKANAALPPTVNVMTVSNDEIERAITNGRVRRRF